jgi:hypothetical protein
MDPFTNSKNGDNTHDTKAATAFFRPATLRPPQRQLCKQTQSTILAFGQNEESVALLFKQQN